MPATHACLPSVLSKVVQLCSKVIQLCSGLDRPSLRTLPRQQLTRLQRLALQAHHCLMGSWASPNKQPLLLPKRQTKLLPQTTLSQVCSVSLKKQQLLQLRKQRKLHHQATLSRGLLPSPSSSAKQRPAKPRQLPPQLLTLPKKLYPQETH